MLSLYLHIPFCIRKCHYCSFFVTPEQEVETGKMQALKKSYFNIVQHQIEQRKDVFPNEQIRTIYIGGGTPFQLGSELLIQTIETILQTRDCTYLEELTIELNPDPIEDVLKFVEVCNKRRSHLYRLRRSFGIQSFDDPWLEKSGRGYAFKQLPDFFRALYNSKQPNVCYNADFIAFGKNQSMHTGYNESSLTMKGSLKEGSKSSLFIPRQEEQRSFFDLLLKSHLLDSLSIYTLELFPGSKRYNQQKKELKIKDRLISPLTNKEGKFESTQTSNYNDSIAEEFHRLSAKAQQYGYQRYEISNFALPGKRSIHNMIYRTMQSYLGLGIHASSMLTRQTLEGSGKLPTLLAEKTQKDIFGIRFQSPQQRKKVEAQYIIEEGTIIPLNERERLTEELMLKLRTDQRIIDWERYILIMEKNRKKLLDDRLTNAYISKDKQGRQMTDAGRNVANTLITELIRF